MVNKIKLYSNDAAFWYVEDGKMVIIETLMDKNNEKIIEKVIGG